MRRVHGVHKLTGIESLRGIAALMVIMFHVVHVLKLTPPDYLDFIRSNFGHGVPLFYTLSGFVLAYGYADRLERHTEILAFYVRRLFRIAPLFYVMLVAWITLGWFVWHKVYPLRTIFLNITFIFGLVPGEHESIVWAGWSIGIEMLFYLLFPIIAFLISNVRGALFALCVACVLSDATHGAMTNVGVGSYAYMNLVTHLPNFIAGVAIYRIWQRACFAHTRIGWLFLVIGLGLAVGLVTGPFSRLLIHYVSPFAPLYAWSLTFSFLILATITTRIHVLERGPLPHLGKLSFSLYLVHPMILFGLKKLGFVHWLLLFPENYGVRFIVGSFLVFIIVWAVGVVTFRWIEVPGMSLGRTVVVSINDRERKTTYKTNTLPIV